MLASKALKTEEVSTAESNIGVLNDEDTDIGPWTTNGEIFFGLVEETRAAYAQFNDYINALSIENCIPLANGMLDSIEISIDPGFYCIDNVELEGKQISLTNQPDSPSEYIFYSSEDLVLTENSQLIATNGFEDLTVTWIVAGNAFIDDNASLFGTFLVKQDISIGRNVKLAGRVVSLEGSIHVGSIQITNKMQEYALEPIKTEIPPVVELPIEESPEPVLETPEPIEETQEPVLETPEPIEETLEPALETPEPIEESPEPIEEVQEPVEEVKELIEETQVPEIELAPIMERTGTIELPGKYIVVFKDDASFIETQASIGSLVSSLGGELHFVYEEVLNGFAATLSEDALSTLQRNATIEAIYPDEVAEAADNGTIESDDLSIDADDDYGIEYDHRDGLLDFFGAKIELINATCPLMKFTSEIIMLTNMLVFTSSIQVFKHITIFFILNRATMQSTARMVDTTVTDMGPTLLGLLLVELLALLLMLMFILFVFLGVTPVVPLPKLLPV